MLNPAHSTRVISVIGAGSVGRGIAHATALAGYATILEDILPANLRSAQSDIRTRPDGDAALSRITYASSIEDAVRQSEFVIEAVPDEIESKLEIFSLLDRISRPGTVLASSTFSLRITDITDVTHCAQRCVGMRFVPPVHEMTELEIVRAVETDDATFVAAMEVASRLGKQVKIVQETREIALS